LVHCIYNIQIALIFKRKRCHYEIALTGENLYPQKNKFLATPLNSTLTITLRRVTEVRKWTSPVLPVSPLCVFQWA